MKKLSVTFFIVLISITIIAQAPYCSSTYSNQTDDWITHFEFNTISNYSGQEGTDSYGDYTSLSTYLEYAMSYQAEVSFVSNGFTQHVWIFIDWNQDDDFYDSNEAYDLGQGVDETLYAYIWVPNEALPGNTRLRVIEQYSTDPGPCDPHTPIIWGETEDYTVDIITNNNIWEGTVDINWHNPANWRYNFVPDATVDVDIWEATNKCWVYAADAECFNLTVRHGTGANFLKVFDEDLHVHGSFIIYGQLILDHPAGRLIAENDVYWESGSSAYFPNYDEFLVYGDWYFNNGANVQINNGTVEFVGTDITFIVSHNADCYFNNISCNKTGSGLGQLNIYYASSQDLNIHGNINIQPNSLMYCTTPEVVRLQGDLINSGMFECYNGTFVFDGDEQVISENLSYTTTTNFNNLTISSANNTSIWYKDINVNHITIESGYIATNHTIHVGGNWYNQTSSPGLSGNSTVEFYGGTDYHHCSNETFHTLEMNNLMGGALLISGTDVICSNYKWTAGEINVEAGGSFTAIDLLDDGIFGTYYLSSGGAINLSNYDGSVDLNGVLNISGGAMNIYGGTSCSFWPYLNNALISMSDGILDFHEQGIIIYDAAPYHLTENITGGTIRTAGGFYGETNEFTPDYGILEFYGSIDEYISTENGCYLNNVVINKSNELSIVGGLLDINGNLTINSGVLNTMGYDIQIEGNWTNNVGEAGFIESTGTVVFNGYNSGTIFSNETFYNVFLDKINFGFDVLYLTSGKTINTNNFSILWGHLVLFDNSSMNIAGDVNIDHGEIDVMYGTNVNITVGGNWSDNNIVDGFYTGGETITINGSSDQIFSTNYDYGYMDFNNLIINKTGGYFRPDDTLVVLGDLNITAGDWLDNVAGLTHYLHGNFTIGSTGNYYPEGTTVFAGTNDQHYETYGGSGYFKNIIVDKSSKGKPGKEPKSMTLTLNSDMVVFNGNTTTIEEGIFNLNGNDFKSTGDININDGGGLIVDAGSSLSIISGLYVNNGGLFTASGLSGNKANIWKDGAGNYSFEVNSGGNISAEHAIFKYMDYNGVYLHPGALVDPVHSFHNCTFQDGVSGGNMLTIYNNQDLTVENAVFMSYSWVEDYNVYKNSTSGNVTFINAMGNFAGESYEFDPYNLVHWGDPQITLNLTVFLEGPYNGTNMNTGLNDLSILPLTQPYNTAPWNYGGTESVPSIPDVNIVDWLLVELRDAPNAASATSATIVEQQASFLLNDGSLVGLDGSSILSFNHSIIQSLFVVIWHRNHLGIMSANPITESGGVYTYNFTTSAGQAYGTDAQKNLAGGVYGMFGGDANADGDVNTNDKIIWANDAGAYGYKSADFNMDGQTENKDKNDIWQQNIGESSQLPWQCGDDLTDIRDGQTYATVQIGTQCWMAENLNIGTMVSGTTTQTDNGNIEKYCYNNSTGNCDTYGGLYQWDEMMQYVTTPGVQGICPSGWHLPTDAEWCTLENEVDAGSVSCSALGWRGTDVGGNLKETGTTHWHHPNTGTNLSGFTALGSGYRNTNGTFSSLTYGAYLWTSNVTGSAAWYRGLWHGYTEVNRYYDSKTLGYSVRCLQD